MSNTNVTCATAAWVGPTLPVTLTAAVSPPIPTLWYTLKGRAEGTLQLDFTSTNYQSLQVTVFRGSCASLVAHVPQTSIALSSVTRTLRFGVMVGVTYFIEIASASSGFTGTVMSMTVTDDRFPAATILGVFAGGNTNAHLGSGNGVPGDTGNPIEVGWTESGDFRRTPLITNQWVYNDLDRDPATGYVYAVTEALTTAGTEVWLFTPDMGLLRRITALDGYATAALRVDTNGRLWRIKWNQPAHLGVVTRIDPSTGAETDIVRFDGTGFLPIDFGSGMCPSPDGSVVYVAYRVVDGSAYPSASEGFIHKYSAAGASLGLFCELPGTHSTAGSPAVPSSVVKHIRVSPVTGEVVVSAWKNKSNVFSGGSLLHYSTSGTLLHTWFDTTWTPGTSPDLEDRVDGVAFDPVDPDLVWVVREHLATDSGGNSIAGTPLGSLAQVRLSTGAVVFDISPHNYFYGQQIAIGGIGPAVLLAPPPGEVIFTNHDDGIPGLTHVEITMRDAPVVSPSFFLAPMVILPPPSISLFTGPLLTEDFEAYATRAISDADLGAWSCYQIGLEAGTGHTGSKAAVSYQGALQHYVVNTPPLTRWGRTVVWAYRFSAAELTARGRDPSTYYHGINIQPAPTIGYAGDHSGFGVLNDTHALYGAGDPDDMVVWTYWRTLTGTTGTYTARASNVVVDSVWQKFDFRWKLSTVGTSGLFLEANGCVQLLVDDVVVLDLTGLLVTLADNTGPSVENSWDGVYYAFGGLVDDLSISNESAICPDGPPTEVIFTNDRTPGMTHIEITMSDEE